MTADLAAVPGESWGKAAVPDMLHITPAGLRADPGPVWEHLASGPGAFVRVTRANGEVLGFIYPPDHSPPGYVDDTPRVRAAWRRQRHIAGSAAWHTRRAQEDGQAHD